MRAWRGGLWRDRVELDSLTMLEDKRALLSRNREKNRLATADTMTKMGINGVATTAPVRTGEDESIVNRSPRTTNNNYPVRSDAPWVALIAFLLILGLAAMLMWWSAQPKPVAETPASPAVKAVATVPGTPSKSDPN